VAHLAPEIPTAQNTAVDIYIDGALTSAQGLTFGNSTGFEEFPPGEYLLGIAPAGGEPTFSFTISLSPRQISTVVVIRTVANRGLPLDVIVLDGSLDGLQVGNGRLVLGHGADDTSLAVIDGINTNDCPPPVLGFESVIFGTARGPGDFAVGVEPGAMAAPGSCVPLAGPSATPIYPGIAVLSVVVDLDTVDGSLDVAGFAMIGDAEGPIPRVPELSDQPGAGGCDVGLCALDDELKTLCEASLDGCLNNVDPSRTDECFLGAPVICQATDRDIAYEDNFDDGVAWQWVTFYTIGPNITIEEVTGRVEITWASGQAGIAGSAGYLHVCGIAGDFDFKVDYELIDWPAMNGARLFLIAATPPPTFDGSVQRASFGDPLTDFPGIPEREVYIMDVAFRAGPIVATADLAGTLRLERVGTTLNGYYRSESSEGDWIPVESRSGFTSDDVSVNFSLGTEVLNTNQQVKVALDNLVVTSGQVTCEGCGDGVLGGGESCDDGNVLDGDGCSRTCSLE
jgi:cysteine-rich repeat protein